MLLLQDHQRAIPGTDLKVAVEIQPSVEKLQVHQALTKLTEKVQKWRLLKIIQQSQITGLTELDQGLAVESIHIKANLSITSLSKRGEDIPNHLGIVHIDKEEAFPNHLWIYHITETRNRILSHPQRFHAAEVGEHIPNHLRIFQQNCLDIQDLDLNPSVGRGHLVIEQVIIPDPHQDLNQISVVGSGKQSDQGHDLVPNLAQVLDRGQLNTLILEPTVILDLSQGQDRGQ